MFKVRFQRRSIASLLLAAGLALSCTTEQKFPSIDTKFSGPIDLVAYNNFFYVLNSDFDRRYNEGSILRVDAASGEKLSVANVPRLGRSLYLQDNYLMVSFDPVDLEENSQGSVRLYEILEDGSLELKYQQDLLCSPINAQLSPSRKYGVVSCTDGDLFVASLDPETMQPTSKIAADSELLGFKEVREYRYPRRALYFYEKDDTRHSFCVSYRPW